MLDDGVGIAVAERIEAAQSARRDGSEVRYTVCTVNGCWESCLLACTVKDGELVSIDVGDPLVESAPGDGFDEGSVRKGMFQHRPCVRGRMWRKTLDAPTRALYPMKNIGKKGDPVWRRISWDEALDILVDKMREFVDEYGPYSIYTYLPLEFEPYAGFGFSAWGMSSFSGHQIADNVVVGLDDYGVMGGRETQFSGTEPPDLLNTKLVVGIGWNPAVTRPEFLGPLVALKEKGVPIVIVDPRYTPTARTFATQWIPIRPGTDDAFLLAIADVIFREDLVDHAFVEAFVEPEGLGKWKAYVLGESDGIEKTPEWAEAICAVPAETIRSLARLYGAHHGYSDGNPCYFKLHWSAARIERGENVSRMGIYLQALTGNIGVPGGYFGGGEFVVPPFVPPVMVNFGKAAPSYAPPSLMYVRGLADAILLKDDVKSGKMSEAEYRRRIGCAQDWPLPDIHMIFNQTGAENGSHDNQRLWEAYKKCDFVVERAYHMDRPEVRYADLVLPTADPFFEDANDAFGMGGFVIPVLSGVGNYGNYFMLSQKIIDPPGEARPLSWINGQIAKRLGVAEQSHPRFLDVMDDLSAWNARFEELQREAWENWRPQYEQWAAAMGIEPREAPSYDEFLEKPLFRVPLAREPFYAFGEQVRGERPFDTVSGKIEFYSDFLADPDMADKEFVFPRSGNKPGFCYGGEKPPVVKPMAEYQPAPDHPQGELAQDYPFRMVTPHSFFRQHTSQDNNGWVAEEAEHALWMNAADAAALDVDESEFVRVIAENGEAFMPVHATEKIAPGTVCSIYGAWYVPSDEKSDLMPDGVDVRGSANNFTVSRHFPWVCATSHCSSQVRIEKTDGGAVR